ncbi:hypothetical protein [Granulicella sp. L60]|uniref:hypothetical protein n=1 Tax=Granulicella sp. L60 TaxID=1641866 RepID=UPI00131B3803|nr:hypothetical protein [Granulicella sp. L60]
MRTLDHAELERAQIESVFGLQRRAAIRMMAPFVAGNRNGSWRVERERLIAWLESLEPEVKEKQLRHQRVIKALQDVQAENQALREELRRQGRPDPPSWRLKQDVLARSMVALPTEIALAPGLISVSFPEEDPTRGARLLHELSLAMLNDWTTFCTLTGPAQPDNPANKIDRLLDKLEWEKQQAVNEFVT